MLRTKPGTIAQSLGLPWPLAWKLTWAESLFLVPTFLLAIAFELYGDVFGKQGIAISLPESFGSIPHFQPKLFPMELYLLAMGLLTLTRIRRFTWASLRSPLGGLVLFLLAFGVLRAAPDLRANPMLVVRNLAFVWYLGLPLLIALFPMPSLRWESFFRLLYFVTFLYFTASLAVPIYSGDPRRIFWSIDLGLLLGLAYGLCAPTSLLPRIALTMIGFVLGVSYFSTLQRTTLVGFALTVGLLVISPFFFSGSLPRPRWRRTAWIALGLATSVLAITVQRAWQSEGGFVAGATKVIQESDPRHPVDTAGGGLEKFRYHLWQDAWDEFKSAPLTGIGFAKPVVYRVYAWKGEFWENNGSFEQRTRFDNERTSPPIAGPHNSYLNAIARMGVWGAGFLLLHLACGWFFLTRCYFACFFVLLQQMLYAFFNVSLEGPIRSFPLLLLVGVGLKLAGEKGSFGAFGDFARKFKRPARPAGAARRVGLVHVPYRFLGGEDQYVETLRRAYVDLGFEPVSIPPEGQASDLLMSAARSLSLGNPTEWDSIMEKNGVEFLHLNNIHAALGPAFLRWIIARGIPTVMTVHNHRFYCTNGLALYGTEVCKKCRPKASLLRPILRNCNDSLPKSIYHSTAMKEIRGDELLSRAVTRFLAPSPYIARELQVAGISASNVTIFPHAVDVSRASASGKVPPADVVFVGRLSPEKGVTHLLAAARKLPQRTFAIIGTGPMEAEVKAAVAAMPHVKFHGQVERADALAALRDARVVCVPSVCHESFSLVAAEALSFGRRLVVPDTQSFLHYGEEPISAVTAVVTNPESLAYSIEMALAQPARSAAETETIRERFSVEGFRKRLAQVVAGLAG